jgi:hypothetical protein
MSRYYIGIMSTDDTGDIEMSVGPAGENLLDEKKKEEGEETDNCVEQDVDIDSPGTAATASAAYQRWPQAAAA